MNNLAFGIDLGTSNIRIYNSVDDNIMMEKNMIAIENKRTIFAYGDSAFEMYEKAPGNIHISYPLSNGVIADINNMEIIIKYFVTSLLNGNIKPAYDDLKTLFENANATDYFYIKSAENTAKIGLYSLSELAMNMIKEKDISNIVTEDIRHYYFPKEPLKLKKELYLAELYSNIVFNEQSGETINELKNAGLEDDYTNYLLAFAYTRNKDYKNAKDYIEKAVELNPDNINYQILNVEILVETGKEKEALKIINKLSAKQIYSSTFKDKLNASEEYIQYKLAKNDILKNYYLGYYYYYEKAYEKAIRTLSAINKKNNNVMALLSRIYFDSNEYDKALGFAQKAKNSALANEVKGDYFMRKKDYDLALKAYKKASSLDKNNLSYMEKTAQTGMTARLTKS